MDFLSNPEVQAIEKKTFVVNFDSLQKAHFYFGSSFDRPKVSVALNLPSLFYLEFVSLKSIEIIHVEKLRILVTDCLFEKGLNYSKLTCRVRNRLVSLA